MTNLTRTVDGSPVSEADLTRMRAEQALHDEWQRRTVRVVAAAANDADDCRLLLSILGLDRDVVAAARRDDASHVTAHRKRRKAAA